MALNSDGVMLLAPGMLWGMLRERPVPLEALEVLEPDAWACGDDGLGDSIQTPARAMRWSNAMRFSRHRVGHFLAMVVRHTCAVAAQTCAAIAVTDFCASWFHQLLLSIPPGSSCQKKQLNRLCHIRKCQKNQQKIQYRAPNSHKWFEVGQTTGLDPIQFQPIPKSLTPPSVVSGVPHQKSHAQQ